MVLLTKPWRATAVAAATFLGVAGASLSTGSVAAHASPSGAEVDALTTPTFGATLEVGGNSPLAGAPLYMITSDTRGQFGCTTTLEDTFMGPITCTGPESDIFNGVLSDEWPAFTTDGPLVAGPGVQKGLLGTVNRPGIGNQVTYAGHPLYLFEPPSNPFVPFGLNFLETTLPLPPWQGLWGLVNAGTGGRDEGPATIETETLPDGSTAVAYETYNNALPGGVPATAYSSTGGHGHNGVTNTATWIPVLTYGAPQAGPGADPGKLGMVKDGNGAEQVTYNGQPLFIYAGEEAVFSGPSPSTAGNGAGVPGPTGSPMMVVTP